MTAAGVAPVFSASEPEVDDQRTAYGLAAFSDDDNAYVAVSRRSETRVRLLQLEDRDGRVGYKAEDTLDLPGSFTLPNGKSWTPCADPGDHAQVEGMVVDQEEHVLYAAQRTSGCGGSTSTTRSSAAPS